MSKTIRVTAAIKIPTPPNFLRYEDPALHEATVPIESLTDEQLRKLGELWTEALLAHAQRRRETP